MKIRFIMIFGLENSRSHHWTRDSRWEFACRITASYKRRGIHEFTFLQKAVNADFTKFMIHEPWPSWVLFPGYGSKVLEAIKIHGKTSPTSLEDSNHSMKKWKFFDYKMSNILFCLSYLKSDVLDCTLRHFGCLRTSPRSLIFFSTTIWSAWTEKGHRTGTLLDGCRGTLGN